MAQTLFRSYGDFPTFTGEGRPQVPLCALFQAQAGTRVEPLTMFETMQIIMKPVQSLNGGTNHDLYGHLLFICRLLCFLYSKNCYQNVCFIYGLVFFQMWS